MVNKIAYQQIAAALQQQNVGLVAVSKLKSVADIETLYAYGHRDFGENYVQELLTKQEVCPADIRWHFIGHLQSNKVKFIAPFVHLIHGVDSFKLLKEINKQGMKNNRIIHCLLQVFIASEETKFGLSEAELWELIQSDDLRKLNNISIKGLMGMASFSDNAAKVESEFTFLHHCFLQLKSMAADKPNVSPEILSMGMSNDYQIAIAQGSNLVRIGSLIFGSRG